MPHARCVERAVLLSSRAMPSESSPAPGSAPPRRRLGFLGVLALGLNTIIGSGIFRLPADLARDLGALAPLAYLVGAVVLLPVAISYARAARACPVDGSAYAYATRAFGPRVGVVVGVSIVVATVTTWASAASALPGQLAPSLGPRAHTAIALAVVATLGLVAALDIRRAGRLGTPIALFKAGALVAVAAAGFFAAPTATASRVAMAPSAFGGALLLVVFALSGFEAAAVPGGATNRASYTLPRAILGSLLGAALVYAVLQAALFRVVPGLASSERPVADGAGVLFGAAAARAVGVLGAVSIFGLGHAMAVTAPVVVRAVAGAFPHSAGAARATRHGAALSATLTALLVATLDFRALVDFTSVLVMAQYAITALAVPRLARDDLRRVRTWVVPALATLAAFYVAAHASRLEIGIAVASILPGVALAFRRPVGPDDGVDSPP